MSLYWWKKNVHTFFWKSQYYGGDEFGWPMDKMWPSDSYSERFKQNYYNEARANLELNQKTPNHVTDNMEFNFLDLAIE